MQRQGQSVALSITYVPLAFNYYLAPSTIILVPYGRPSSLACFVPLVQAPKAGLEKSLLAGYTMFRGNYSAESVTRPSMSSSVSCRP
jgi:hypothetical protein